MSADSFSMCPVCKPQDASGDDYEADDLEVAKLRTMNSSGKMMACMCAMKHRVTVVVGSSAHRFA